MSRYYFPRSPDKCVIIGAAASSITGAVATGVNDYDDIAYRLVGPSNMKNGILHLSVSTSGVVLGEDKKVSFGVAIPLTFFGFDFTVHATDQQVVTVNIPNIAGTLYTSSFCVPTNATTLSH